MQGNSRLGCFGIIALSIAVYSLWIAVLYVGIPLAIIGCAVTWYLWKKSSSDDIDRQSRDSQTGAAIAIGLGSLLLGTVSVVGNIFSDVGPFADPVEVVSPSDDQYGPPKVSVTPEDCAKLRAEPQFYNAVKAACYRAYPTDGWGDSAGRVICEGDHWDKMKACGVTYERK